MIRIAFLCLLSLSALADEVRLTNGDRITGRVREVTSERLVVRTEYARTISIELDEVHSLSIVDADGNAHEIGPLEVRALNVKAYRRTDGVDYTGRAFLSAALERGNAASDRVHARGELAARARRYRYELSGRIERRTEPPEEAGTAWLAEGNYDRFLDEHRFVYVRGSFEHDRPKDIELRRTTGAGYGRQIFESRTVSLSARAGLDHVSEDRFAAPGRSYPALGWGIKASYSPRRPELELFHEQEGFWNLEDTQVVVLRSKSGIRVPIVGALKASVQVKLDWERRPSPGRRSTDTTLLFGLDYDF
jgi:hypothetical protein